MVVYLYCKGLTDMKKILALILLCALVPNFLLACTQESEEGGIASSSTEESTTESKLEGEAEKSDAPTLTRPEEISIVVLGDSIARGATLGDVENDRYSALLAEMLKKDYKAVSVANYGIDGQTGAELLESIKANPAKELSDCDYIIISIGGNNILQFLNTLEGAEEFTSGISPEIFASYFRYIIAETEEEKQSLAYTCETISNAFGMLNSAYASEQFDALIDSASAKLRQEIPQIVSELKSINGNAEIIIQTVYNPYKDMIVKLTDVKEILDMDKNGESAVSRLNAPIKELAEENGYTVIDIYSVFEESIKTLTFAGVDVTKASFSLDPHPNEKGHALIAETYYKYLTEKYDG